MKCRCSYLSIPKLQHSQTSVEVWEWISNFIPRFTMNLILHAGTKLHPVNKMGSSLRYCPWEISRNYCTVTYTSFTHWSLGDVAVIVISRTYTWSISFVNICSGNTSCIYISVHTPIRLSWHYTFYITERVGRKHIIKCMELLRIIIMYAQTMRLWRMNLIHFTALKTPVS